MQVVWTPENFFLAPIVFVFRSLSMLVLLAFDGRGYRVSWLLCFDLGRVPFNLRFGALVGFLGRVWASG